MKCASTNTTFYCVKYHKDIYSKLTIEGKVLEKKQTYMVYRGESG